MPVIATNGHGDAFARVVNRSALLGLVPLRVVVPLLVALRRLGEGAFGLLAGGVRPEAVDRRAEVLAGLDAVVLDSEPELAGVRVGHAHNLD